MPDASASSDRARATITAVNSPPDPDDHAWRTALLESSLDCVIVMDAEGRVVDLNARTEVTLGVVRERVIGERLGDVFVPPDLRARHEAGLRRYLSTRESSILGVRVEVEALHGSGRRLPVELSIVRLAGTEPPLFVGHLRPIADRLQSERRLRASAAASRVLATSRRPDLAVEGVLRALGEELRWAAVQFWRLDRPSERMILSASWLREGMDPTHYRGQTSMARGEGLPGLAWAERSAIWLEEIAEKATELPRFSSLVAAGVRSCLCFPVHIGGVTVAAIEAFSTAYEPRDEQLLVILEAIGGQLGHVNAEHVAREALTRSEQALRDALHREREARQSAEEANAAKDQFLAVISHELRTPLGPIIGWARMLESHALDPEVRTKAVAAITRNAELQSRLVEDLLDASRIAAGKLTIERVPVSIVHVVHAAIETAAPLAHQQGVQLRLEGEFEIPPVSGDARRLQQVFSNLLSNALKFTPAGGEVTVLLSRVRDEVEICVRDTGAGIDPVFLPHMFERFRQAPGQPGGHAGGLGLGLAIVRDLVNAHGGSVYANSDGPGRGATFTVRLPSG